jgi:hypothetical protein
MHGIEAADGCLNEWSCMKGAARIRECSACHLKVIDVEGLNENDMKALVCAQGYDAGDTKLFRRADGRFVLGDCFQKRYANFPTAVGFSLAPFISYVFIWHLPLSVLASPLTFFVLGPTLAWLLIGVALVRKTRSAVLGGVVFTIFVLPSLLAPIFLVLGPHPYP